MLPDLLQSSYKTYKEDTNVVATWLAATAKKCGYPSDLLSNLNDSGDITSPSSAVKKPRLKGRARKAQKEAEKDAENRSTDRPAPASLYTIMVKDFLSLAKYIAGSTKQGIEIPEIFAYSLKRAISLRRKHSAWSGFRTTSYKDVAHAKSNESHKHFLGILEETFSILKPYMPAHIGDVPLSEAATGGSTTSSNMGDDIPLSNFFNKLEVEEPSEAFLNAPGLDPAAAREFTAGQQYTAEPPQTLEEEFLALQCFLQDVGHIRSLTKQLWRNYSNGVDLAAAAVTVNTAIVFVRQLEHDFELQFSHKTDYESKIKLFFVAVCADQNQDPEAKERPEDLINFKVYDLVEDIMLGTYSTVHSLQDILQPGIVPVYKPGHFGSRDHSVAWFEKSAREQFKDDQLVLFEAWPDLVLTAMITKKSSISEDELIRGIRGMRPGAKIPLWLVFAFQCFLDAQHILGQDLERPFQDLKQNSSDIAQSIRSTLDFHHSLRVKTWPKSNDVRLMEILTVIKEWVEDDMIVERIRKMRYPLPAPPSFRLLKQFPTLCGLWSFALKLRNQELAIAFTGAWGSIMYAGHLYNACRQENLVSKPWTDMEVLISLQSDRTLFIGDRPTRLEEYLKRFALSMGYSATAFAKDKRKNTVVASSKGPRGLSELGTVSKLLFGRYCNNDREVAWTRESILSIIETKIEDSEDEEEAQSSSTATQGTSKDRTRKTKKPKQASSGALLQAPKSARSTLSTMDFLELFTNALHTETMELTFDYFMMHRCCWSLLRSVNEACQPQLLQMYGGGYLPHESQLPFVVGYIFMACTQTSRMADLLLPKRENIGVSSRLLETAAHVVQGMTESGTGRLTIGKLENALHFHMDTSAFDVFNLHPA